MQGNMDTDFQSQVHFNYRISSSLIAKMQLQLNPGGAGQSMGQFEVDHTGSDYHLNLKAMNPSIIDGPLTGIFVGSYMQSITSRLALGLETMYQRPSGGDPPTAIMAYAARYKTPEWIASMQLLAQGGLNASYWRRIADRVEGGVDVNLQLMGMAGNAGMMGPVGNEGSATIGMKYDFRMATFRGQVDSKGRVGCLLDKRVTPTLGIIFAGELDHFKVRTPTSVFVHCY